MTKPFEPQEWQGEFVLSSSDYVAQYILAPVIVAEVSADAPNINLAYRLWQPNYLESLKCFKSESTYLACFQKAGTCI
ncbi:hypothetical protein OH492_15980 [Vibrio chagasii]|nr:hypothetical protein [Vibrio chagasii]